jgi:hypothetical protein
VCEVEVPTLDAVRADLFVQLAARLDHDDQFDIDIESGFGFDPDSPDDRLKLTKLEQQLHHALCA